MSMNEHAQQQIQQMDPYDINSLGPTTLAVSTTRNGLHPSHQTISSPEQDIVRQMYEFNRSVTIIIWYRENTEPIRLQQLLPTYPCFQLSHFPSLTCDLGLTTSSYLDTFNPSSGKWEQHIINTVRLVKTQQRLLYKVRKSLLEGLTEDVCPSLREEVDAQLKTGESSSSTTNPSVGSNSDNSTANTLSTNKTPSRQKRRASEQEQVESEHVSKVHIPDNYYMPQPSGSESVVATPVDDNTNPLPVSPTPSVQSANQTINSNSTNSYYQPMFYPPAPSSSSLSQAQEINNNNSNSSTSQPLPIPYHPHPPLKRWPNDYTVSELSAGFHAMDALIAQSPTGASMTQRTAFERVFGSRYVKSTVCRHRAVWRKAHRSLRDQFEALGSDERACWGEFVRRVEGRPPGKVGTPATETMSPAQGVIVYHAQGGNDPNAILANMNSSENPNSRQQPDDHDGVDEPVMDSLQNSNQNAPSSRNVSIQNGINVYDPSMNHMSNNSHT